MAQETELGLLALPFTIEPGLGVGGRGVRFVRTLLAVKIRFLVSSASPGRRIFRPDLRLEAFHRRPGFDQRAVDRKVVRAQKALHAWLDQNGVQKFRGDRPFEKTVAVLRKYRMIPRRLIDADPDEPAEQKIELQPLHQLALRPDRIKPLQQHPPPQLFRRNRGAPDRRIQRRKLVLQRRQSLVHNHADRAKRVILSDPRLEVDIAEKRSRPLVPTPHDSAPRRSTAKQNHIKLAVASPLFQQPARRACYERGNSDAEPRRPLSISTEETCAPCRSCPATR